MVGSRHSDNAVPVPGLSRVSVTRVGHSGDRDTGRGRGVGAAGRGGGGSHLRWCCRGQSVGLLTFLVSK